MLTLTLLRHAKSSWENDELEDFDRPLNKRGQTSAPLMGAFMESQEIAPDLVLCSSAARARETAGLVLSKLSATPKIKYEKDLYMAGPGALFARVRQVGAKYHNILMIGHNPGFHALAIGLVGYGDEDTKARLGMKFPTCALATFSFDAENWQRIEQASGHLDLFQVPRELA